MSGSLPTQLFLLRLKQVWSDPDRVLVAPRDKNLNSMAELELNMTDVKKMCLGLVPADLVAGPVPDDKGRAGNV